MDIEPWKFATVSFRLKSRQILIIIKQIKLYWNIVLIRGEYDFGRVF